MSNYKIEIQYDGTRYKGWQILSNNDNTIQGKITEAISKITGEEVQVIGSGRTDAGVHAMGQVANFHLTNTKIKDSVSFLNDLNNILPDDIAVISVNKVDGRFHARFSAVSKTYRYRIHYSKIPNVFERRFVYTYTNTPIDVEKMKDAATYFIGEKDFKSFCNNPKFTKSSVRTITNIDITKTDSEIIIDYTGDGFLKGMVRAITGTLIEVATGQKTASEIPSILESQSRENAGYTAPACGLCLMEVRYK